MSRPLDAALPALRALLDGRLSTARAVRDHHSRDESHHGPHLPLVPFGAWHGDVAVEVMRALKAALDPLCLLNPGKVLP